MDGERDGHLIDEYRAVARGEPSAALDRAILALARRRAARVRAVRSGIALCAMLAVAVALLALHRRPPAMQATSMPAGLEEDGLHAGTTRYYLLTVSAIPSGAMDSR